MVNNFEIEQHSNSAKIAPLISSMNMPVESQYTRTNIGKKGPSNKWWLVYSFIACLCLSVFNYTTSNYNPDVLAGKMINSLTLGLFSILFTVGDLVLSKRCKK